jgi:hypothetical protein
VAGCVGGLDQPGKTIRQLRTRVETSEADDVDDAMLAAIDKTLLTLSNEVTARYFGQNPVMSELLDGLG